MQENKNRRAGSVVDRTVQYAFVKRIVGHWCVFMGFAAIATFVCKIMTSRHPGGTWGAYLHEYWVEQLPFVVVAIFLLPVFLVDSNKLSHRFVGPMIRFRRSMREIAAGRSVASISFRPGDFWHDIANDFNSMNDQLKEVRDGEAATTKEPSEPVTAGAE